MKQPLGSVTNRTASWINGGIDIRKAGRSAVSDSRCPRAGVGSRFRATIYHMVQTFSENDSRALPAKRDSNSFADRKPQAER